MTFFFPLAGGAKINQRMCLRSPDLAPEYVQGAGEHSISIQPGRCSGKCTATGWCRDDSAALYPAENCFWFLLFSSPKQFTHMRYLTSNKCMDRIFLEIILGELFEQGSGGDWGQSVYWIPFFSFSPSYSAWTQACSCSCRKALQAGKCLSWLQEGEQVFSAAYVTLQLWVQIQEWSIQDQNSMKTIYLSINSRATKTRFVQICYAFYIVPWQ